MPQEARDDGDRLTGVIEQFDREVSRALPATATHPHRGLPRIADPPIVERPPDGIVAPTGLLTRPAVRHPATSSTQPTVHIRIDIVFGTFDLLGLRFAPRIRDLDRQRLYYHGHSRPAGDTAELLPNRIRPDLIQNSWDAMLRLAASLKHGWAPASLLLTRLQASQRSNPLARALQEHGRLVKTNFILAWLADERLRRRIGRQLNKGESLHAMRRYLCFAGEGRLRHRQADDQSVQAQCLTLVCNAIIVWNTVYSQAALDQLRAEGQLITTTDLERLSPIQHAHIRPYGRYQFNTINQPGQLRPLRQPPARRASERTVSVNRV